MRSFVLPRECEGPSRLLLENTDYHYICRVLRLGLGDSFPAVDKRGLPFVATIVKKTKSECEISLLPSKREADGDAGSIAAVKGPRIVLFQCLPKGRKLDLVVRQATEAGVELVVPVLSEHCVAREGSEARGDRLKRIAREAAQQSGTPVLTQIADCLPIGEVPDAFAHFSGEESSVAFFFHQEPLAQASLHGYLSPNPRAVGLLIGPEGGLSARETDALEAAGFKAAYLGSNVLRTETAALYAVAAVRIILLEKESWLKNS